MSSKSHFFKRLIKLFADYQFNNNLIDDANGYNLTGTNITYNNGNAVFNGATSVARRTDAEDLFSFTDGVNDLPFRIETEFRFSSFSGSTFQFIANKRQQATTSAEWQLLFAGGDSALSFILWSLGTNTNNLKISKTIPLTTGVYYDIVIDYDGSGTLDGLNMKVNGVNATDKTELGTYANMIKTTADFTLGTANFGGNTTFNGVIDYLKIYK